MTRQQLTEQIFSKKTYLCIGLDTDLSKIPAYLQSHPDSVFEFNKAIIDATKDLCVSYKINTAFYEAMGVKGWEAMQRTVDYIPSTHFKIADGKRGDIGNTSSQYAKAFFETLPFDAITVAPYMGADSVKPFLEYKNKWTIVLGLTSNKGAEDFEMQKIIHKTTAAIESARLALDVASHQTELLYEKVLRNAAEWGTLDNLMFVIGTTKADAFTNVRRLVPDHFLLAPGVGTQGGSLKDISEKGMTKDCGLLVNISRAIIYAAEDESFAEEAAAIARQYQYEMQQYLQDYIV